MPTFTMQKQAARNLVLSPKIQLAWGEYLDDAAMTLRQRFNPSTVFTKEPSRRSDQMAAGKGSEFATNSQLTAWDTKGTLTSEADAELLGWMLALLFGVEVVTGVAPGPYTHTFSIPLINATMPPTTIYVEETADQHFKLCDMAASSLSLTVPERGAITSALDMVGTGRSAAGDFSTELPALVAANYLLGSDMQITVAPAITIPSAIAAIVAASVIASTASVNAKNTFTLGAGNLLSGSLGYTVGAGSPGTVVLGGTPITLAAAVIALNADNGFKTTNSLTASAVGTNLVITGSTGSAGSATINTVTGTTLQVTMPAYAAPAVPFVGRQKGLSVKVDRQAKPFQSSGEGLYSSSVASGQAKFSVDFTIAADEVDDVNGWFEQQIPLAITVATDPTKTYQVGFTFPLAYAKSSKLGNAEDKVMWALSFDETSCLQSGATPAISAFVINNTPAYLIGA
jgi:hypothetical protein